MTTTYPGLELDLFAAATHWKGYVAETLLPYIRGRIAGIGSVGYLAALKNRPLLRASISTRRHIDRLIAYRFGKTVIGIWKSS